MGFRKLDQFKNEFFSTKISTPFLSILIPTYDYPEGLDRILAALGSVPNDVEVLVFDDSSLPDLKKIAVKYSSLIPRLIYRHNLSFLGKSLGAGDNWNSLLNAAQGDYVVLMHHDEFPLGSNFIAELRLITTKIKSPDVLLFDLILVDDCLSLLPRHTPRFFRWLVTQYIPGYLFRRNVIGPTATLAVRRSIVPRFDSQLRWLIDVDFYVQLCRTGLLWSEASNIKIVSVQRKTGTITNELTTELSRIDSEERFTLGKRYRKDSIWLGGAIAAPIRFLEFLIWIFLRGNMIALYRFCKLMRGRNLDCR